MKYFQIKRYLILILLFFCVFKNNAQNDKQQKAILLKLNEIHKPTFKTRDSLSYLYKVINEKAGYTNDTIIKNKLYQKIDELDVLASKNDAKELENELKFINEFPSNKIALEILMHKITKKESVEKIDKINSTFNNLSNELKYSATGLSLKQLIISLQNSVVGSRAPNFFVKDIKGTSWSLDMFKGKKYVLLTFWNSNSSISSKENVYLKDLHKKYSDKGLEIISISLDENMNDLMAAIKHQKTDMFINVSLITNKISIVDDYFVNAIPHKILIDKNGIIIERWYGCSNANKKKIATTLGNIFNQKNASTKK